MRSSVSAVFFLAMAPLGSMAIGVAFPPQFGPSNVQDTSAGGEAKDQHLAKHLRQGGERARGRENDGLRLSTDMETLLGLHNEARCLHNADPLTYSDDVAASAMAHAEVLSSSCGDFYHSASGDRNGYGENLYLCWGSGSGSCYTPERAMDSLYEDEVQVNSVTEYGEHATQILWKSTTELGCAEATCTKDSSNYVYLVCQYNPPANFVGRVEQELELPSGGKC